jgi:opacity protein-like surface antigen
MKKIIYAVSLMAICSAGSMNTANAQAFEEGSMAATLGYGFPNLGKSILSAGDYYEDEKIFGVGPMHARFEYGLTDRFGIGVSINFATFGHTWNETYDVYNSTTGLYTSTTYEYEEKVTSLAFLIRFNRHFEVSDKVDIFSGFGLGYNSWKATYSSNNPNDTNESISFPIPIGMEATLGVRFYFTDNIGAYIEAGWAKSIIQGGIAFKF